ncbi:gem-associated protein 2-like [Tropilaelaps mercedesae]|uniref:Gem-associated protein 2 n=1 Tax=Tropilaelaps mercedesae TaxID=418985 RepID=A0A1V9XEU6_9ACAR|nr:gem-associated protein 2-like [Tropilaelaps mercedesae]
MNHLIYKRGNDSDDDEDRPRAALPFDAIGEPADESQAPTTGNEYLRRVHKEAMECPQVVVASISPSKLCPVSTVVSMNFPAPEKLPPPQGFEPSLDWQLDQVFRFSEVRRKFALEKQQLTAQVGSKGRLIRDLDGVVSAEEWGEKIENESSKPLVSVVASIPGAKILQLIGWHADLIERKFSAHQGRWLYALLVALEKPLSPEACDSIRALARAASRARLAFGEHSAILAEDDNQGLTAQKENMTALNLIICLVSRYFSQTDLAD